MEGKKFAVLQCAEDSEYVKRMYGGYFCVFVNMLAEEGETWDVYRVVNGEFPDDHKINGYDGFVITGSGSDAHSNELWICKLLNLLKKLNAMKKKVLGICFGHQILARSLGGKTGRAASGWDIGVTRVNLSSPAKLFSSPEVPASLSIIEIHRDEVWELPPETEVIAWSNKTGIEMFKCGNHIMGIQGHPEYTSDILLNLVNRLLQHNLIEESIAHEAKIKLVTREPDRDEWKKLCTKFLKGGL